MQEDFTHLRSFTGEAQIRWHDTSRRETMCNLVKWSCNFVIICMLLLAVAGVTFAIDNPDQSSLIGTGGFVDVAASITQVAGVSHQFKYEYTFTFTQWYADLDFISIGNPNKIDYWNGGSNMSEYFSNPTYNSRSTSIKWQLLNPGTPYPIDMGPITVWYYADTSHIQGVSVSVGGAEAVQATADPSDYTIGMATPEPASLAAMGIGLLGFGGTLLRLRRK